MAVKKFAVLGIALAVLVGGVTVKPSPRVTASELDKINDEERDLVKKVYETRNAYQAALEELRSYYAHISHQENQYWSEKELTDFHLALKSPYILDMDLPSNSMKPTKSDPKANRMFREALDWLEKVGVDKEQNVKRAEILLQRVIHDFKDCDKVDEACYYLGEIYSTRYFQMYRRSVAYYERVFLYEPDTNLDARMRAAYIYERYLGNSQRAVALYQEVLAKEINPEQTREAKKRLDYLLRR